MRSLEERREFEEESEEMKVSEEGVEGCVEVMVGL
jgi:hypothetical protein